MVRPGVVDVDGLVVDAGADEDEVAGLRGVDRLLDGLLVLRDADGGAGELGAGALRPRRGRRISTSRTSRTSRRPPPGRTRPGRRAARCGCGSCGSPCGVRWPSRGHHLDGAGHAGGRGAVDRAVVLVGTRLRWPSTCRTRRARTTPSRPRTACRPTASTLCWLRPSLVKVISVPSVTVSVWGSKTLSPARTVTAPDCTGASVSVAGGGGAGAAARRPGRGPGRRWRPASGRQPLTRRRFTVPLSAEVLHRPRGQGLPIGNPLGKATPRSGPDRPSTTAGSARDGQVVDPAPRHSEGGRHSTDCIAVVAPPPFSTARAARMASSSAASGSGAPSSTSTYSPRGSTSAQRSTAPARLPRQTSSWSLVSSRASATRRVGATGRDEVGEGAGQAVRRLVEHDRAAFGGHRGHALGAARALARQEALEHEAAGRQPAGHQAGERGRRAGHDHDDVARPPTAAATSRSPGSEMPGMPASLTTATRSPRSRRASTSATAPASVWSFTTSSTGAPHTDVGEQPPGAPGVLARHRVGAAELLDGPGRQVAEVADRRADEHEGAAHRSSRRSPTRTPQSGEGTGLALDDAPGPPHREPEAVGRPSW